MGAGVKVKQAAREPHRLTKHPSFRDRTLSSAQAEAIGLIASVAMYRR